MFNFDFHNPIYINVQMYFNNLKIRVLFIMFIFIGESMANQKIENYMPKDFVLIDSPDELSINESYMLNFDGIEDNNDLSQ